MENRRTRVSLGMGGTLIITVFVALCLMIFAALSFTTAHSDFKLAKKAEEMTRDYYWLHGRAEEKLAEISDVLYDAGFIDKNELISRLSQIEDLSVLDEDKLVVMYEILGDQNQKISVALNIRQDARGYFYEIEAWNLSNIDLPLYEEEIIDVWEGIE